MVKNTDNTSLLFDLQIFSRTNSELLTLLKHRLISQELSGFEGEKPVIVFTPNPEQIIMAHDQAHFLQILQQADILIPDGSGLLLASRILSWCGKTKPLAETIPGADVVTQLLEVAAQQDHTVLVIGGRNYPEQFTLTDLTCFARRGIDDSTKIRDKSSQNYREAVFFTTPGYQDITQPTTQEETVLQSSLRKHTPEIVFVAFGAPFQEQWIIEHQQLLSESGVKLVMAVGGSFDYLFGKVPRAPRWMRDLHLEWLFRLFHQPWRWRRQLRLIQFIGLTLRTCVQHRSHL